MNNPYATATENLNPFLIFDWSGDIDLDPPVDEWKETRQAPELVVNIDGSFDNLARARGLNNTSTQEIPVGTEWNEWQDQWTGNTRTSTNWIKNGGHGFRHISKNITRCCSNKSRYKNNNSSSNRKKKFR